MKRFFAYIVTILLLPRVSSAVILIPKPTRCFSLSQTYIVANKGHKSKSYYAPDVWLSYHGGRQEKKWSAVRRNHNVSGISREMLNRNLCEQKISQSGKGLSGRIIKNSNRKLSQVLH